jgi:hypothetical protein
MTLSSKKRLHADLFKFMRELEELSIRLDADISKSENIDRISIILPGIVATLLMLLRFLEPEIAFEDEQRRLADEFRRLYEEEQRRRPHLKPPEMHPDDDFPPEEYQQ